jgi:Icc-related predicted phosphoesterase
MRLLFTADTHFHKNWYEWLGCIASRYDVIAHGGDFLDMHGAESLSTQVRWVTDWARSLPCPLVFSSGNHDVESKESPVSAGRWLERLPGAKKFSASGHLELMGQSFVRIGWHQEVPPLRGHDILTAHSPPYGTFTSTAKGSGTDSGDLELGDTLRSAVAAPWLVLSGHVHNPSRWVDRCGETFSLNPGMGINPEVPNYITVDTATKKARWFRDGELADAVNC